MAATTARRAGGKTRKGGSSGNRRPGKRSAKSQGAAGASAAGAAKTGGAKKSAKKAGGRKAGGKKAGSKSGGRTKAKASSSAARAKTAAGAAAKGRSSGGAKSGRKGASPRGGGAKSGSGAGHTLSSKQQQTIERSYHGAVEKVDEPDVRYALAKTNDALKTLASSSVAWAKQLGRQVQLLYEMLQEWWNDRKVLPWRTVAAITAALVYFVSPIDVIPDFIPVIGYMDDLAVVGLCIRAIHGDLREYATRKRIDLADYGLS